MKHFLIRFFLLSGLGLTLGLICLRLGCQPEPPSPEPSGPKPEESSIMTRLTPDEWPVLVDDLSQDSLRRAIGQSRAYLNRLPPDRMFQYGSDSYPARHLLDSLKVFEKLYLTVRSGSDLTAALKKHFILYQSRGRQGQGRVLITGYYEPLLEGDLSPSPRFRWPVYGRPEDLIDVRLEEFSSKWAGQIIRGRLSGHRLVPYYTRHEIDRQGALKGRKLELAWVDDPVALFFLHIQGSGRIRLPGGNILRIGYAGSNGRPYKSLGRHMIESGIVPAEGMSMQAISKWLNDHPELMADLLDINESYVFFHILEGDPKGNINVFLTPGRSIALDHRIFPKGALAWLEGRRPKVGPEGGIDWQPLTRFVMVQDTGGAIRGPGRVDLFFGHGREAEDSAGRMKETGRLFFPVLKGHTSGRS